MTQRILVWDLPTRVFHWSLAASFLVAYLTGESERWASLHFVAGYTLLGLLLFRLLWGFTGTPYARFASFVPTPKAVISHLAALRERRPGHPVGHNPAGAVAIFALLGLGLVSGISGWLFIAMGGGEWLEEIHEGAAALMLAVVGLHIAGVLVVSRLQGQNLILSMLNGRQPGNREQAIAHNRPVVALLLVASLLGFWAWSYTERGQRILGVPAVTEGGERPLDDD